MRDGLFAWTTDDTHAVGVNVLSGFIQVLLTAILVVVWRTAARRSRSDFVLGFLLDRRVMLAVITALVLPASVLVAVADPTNNVTLASSVTIGLAICVALLLRELSTYWRTGITHVQSKVAKKTYASSLSRVSRSFEIVGTNAFSYCMLQELTDAMRSVRERGGRMTLVLAHPECGALRAAAAARGSRHDLYEEQGWYSIGRLIRLATALSAPVEIHLYEAARLDDLPIFRAMFLDSKRAIASIAVYGRSDSGVSMPQIFASCQSRSSQAMYNVLWRYYVDFQKRSHALTDRQVITALETYDRVTAENRDLVT